MKRYYGPDGVYLENLIIHKLKVHISGSKICEANLPESEWSSKTTELHVVDCISIACIVIHYSRDEW